MIACIHQPNYLPWLGFFAKIALADVYIVMDNVQFPKNSWTNRVRIAGNGPPLWLTIPVRHDHLATRINEIEIDYQRDWVAKHLKTLQQRYARMPGYRQLSPQIAEILGSRPRRLVDVNIPLIRWILQLLNIRTEIVLGSALDAQGQASQLIVSMCQKLGATVYLAGQGAADYDDMKIYETAAIEYRKLAFAHPQYTQSGQDLFVPGLSVIDMIFNLGTEEAIRLFTSLRGKS